MNAFDWMPTGLFTPQLIAKVGCVHRFVETILFACNWGRGKFETTPELDLLLSFLAPNSNYRVLLLFV